MTVEFTIRGKVTSANLVARSIGIMQNGRAAARTIKSKSARKDTERISNLAIAAKAQAGWRVPNMAAIAIYAYNSGLDVGNIEKVIGDSIKGGVLIVDDRPSHLESLFVKHMPRDHAGERYVVQVTAVHEGLPL